MKKLSIIFTHYSTDEHKSEIGEKFLTQIKNTLDETCELIVVNNGKRDSHFAEIADKYIDNSDRNSLGGARNAGFDIADGEFVCFCDNDVEVVEGWWQECVGCLEKYPKEKLIAGPIFTYVHVKPVKYHRGELDGHLLNALSSSPCFIMSRESFLDLDRFHETVDFYSGFDGVEFSRRQNKRGYRVILTKRPMAFHTEKKNYEY